MPLLSYLLIAILTLISSLIITRGIIAIGRRYRFLDAPQPPLKTHPRETPLLGGIAIFSTFALAVITLWQIGVFTVFTSEPHPLYGLSQDYLKLNQNVPQTILSSISIKNLMGILLASVVLLIGGMIDDKKKLSPAKQFVFPLLATLIVISSGIGIRGTTNPLYALGLSNDPIWDISSFKIKALTLAGIPYFIAPMTDLFTFLWLLGMMYTTKFLDGLDGLVSGISAIGFVILFMVSIMLNQPLVGMFAMILAAANAGFLYWNFHPARIFLGEFGSLWLGFMLGVLAILTEARVSITLLIMGIPILDVLWIIIRRTLYEKRSAFKGDRKHLHFRLLDKGLSVRQAVLFLYAVSATFGLSALFLQDSDRMVSLLLLVVMMILLGFWITRKK